MSYKTNLWISGVGKKESKYYIKKIINKTTTTGKAISFIDINLYDKESKEATNFKITIWGTIQANEGDFVKIKAVSNIGLSTFTTDKGTFYATILLTCDKDDIEIFSNNKDTQPRESEAKILEGLPKTFESTTSDFSDELPF
jgi:hypothetical protein